MLAMRATADPKTYIVSTRGSQTAEAIIFDDEAPELTISVGQSIAEAANAEAAFKVVSNVLPTANLNIQYTPVGEGFIANSGVKVSKTITPSDFTANAISRDGGNSTITVYEAPINVDIINDQLNEPDGSVTLTLNRQDLIPLNHTIGSPTSATIAVTDDDPVPTITIANLTPSVSESSNTISIPVTLSNPTVEPVSIDWGTTAGTATTADFVEQLNQTLNFAASTDSTSNVSNAIVITITDDLIKELDENFTITLSNPQNATFASNNTELVVTVTINDDEDKPTITFTDPRPSVNESAGTLTLTATLNFQSTQSVTAKVTTDDVTATSGSSGDYIAITDQDLTFDVGEVTKDITITINQDNADEGNETFTVTLDEVSEGKFPEAASSLVTTATIVDDDAAVLSFKTTAFRPTENGGNFDVTVMLSRVTTNNVAFGVELGGGTATNGSDYTNPTNLSYSIAPGDTEATISIPITNDVSNEGNETFNFTIVNLTGASFASGAALEQTITIVDDEMPRLKFTNATTTVAENVEGNFVYLELSLTGTSDSNVRVNYDTKSGTATKSIDFLNDQQLFVDIAANSLTGRIRIPIVDDYLDEVDETFEVEIKNVTGAIAPQIFGQRVNTVTIKDNDVPRISISATGAAKEGANATADFTVTADILPHTGLTIYYEPEGAAFLPSGVTETRQMSASPVVFTQASLNDPFTGTLSVALDNDDVAEFNGTITVTLEDENPANINYQLIPGSTQATINVEDDDAKIPVLNVVAPTTATAESAGSVNFVVTAYEDQTKSTSINPLRPISVQYTPEEVDNGDFLTDTVANIATTTELTFTSNNGIWSDVITVNLHNDTNGEPTGKIKITLNNDPATITTYMVTSGADNTAEATIWDDDSPELTIIAGNPVTEGTDSTAAFRVISNVNPHTDLSIQYTPESTAYIANSGISITATPAISFTLMP